MRRFPGRVFCLLFCLFCYFLLYLFPSPLLFSYMQYCRFSTLWVYLEVMSEPLRPLFEYMLLAFIVCAVGFAQWCAFVFVSVRYVVSFGIPIWAWDHGAPLLRAVFLLTIPSCGCFVNSVEEIFPDSHEICRCDFFLLLSSIYVSLGICICGRSVIRTNPLLSECKLSPCLIVSL